VKGEVMSSGWGVRDLGLPLWPGWGTSRSAYALVPLRLPLHLGAITLGDSVQPIGPMLHFLRICPTIEWAAGHRGLLLSGRRRLRPWRCGGRHRRWHRRRWRWGLRNPDPHVRGREAISAQLIPPRRVLDNGGCGQRRRGRDRNRRR